MSTVTYTEFESGANKVIVILIGLGLFSLYRGVTLEFNPERVAMIGASLLVIFSLVRLMAAANPVVEHPVPRSPMERRLTSFILLLVLGTLGLYLFAYKGVYQLYDYWSMLTWKGVLLRLFVIVLSFQLVKATSSIQVVTKSLEQSGR